jgi:protein-tyrosine phosphatase
MTPEVEVPGAINFRDVGGLRAGGGRTRSGMLFRSGNLAHLEPAGTAAIRDLGIRRIVDLRDDDEVAHAPSRVAGTGAVVQRVPLFLGSIASAFELDLSLDEMYRRLLDESASGIAAVARAVVADQPVLVHCTVGKDRTGVSVAIALAAAGVDADEIVADYARTEALLPEWRSRGVIAHLRAMHPDAVHLEELAAKSPAAVMVRLLDDVAARYGSAADYLRAQGMPDDEVAELRRILVA